jgi:hypothetical protein
VLLSPPLQNVGAAIAAPVSGMRGDGEIFCIAIDSSLTCLAHAKRAEPISKCGISSRSTKALTRLRSASN